MTDCKESRIAVGVDGYRSIYDVKKHAYNNGGEPTPHWIDVEKRLSRYGRWINRDFIGSQRPFYLEEEFVS